jgi:hypothetical protein
MSISFVVERQQQLVRARWAGLVGLPDLAQYARALVAEGLLDHAQLIDARTAWIRLTAEETREIAELMASLGAVYGRAPVAFIPADSASYELARRYQELGAGGNPAFQVFEDLAAAETWLRLARR